MVPSARLGKEGGTRNGARENRFWRVPALGEVGRKLSLLVFELYGPLNAY